VREAARVQSFPDWFRFPGARTYQFRLIGNAVPPLVGEALGLAIKGYLKRNTRQGNIVRPFSESLPRDNEEACQRLVALVDTAASKALRKVPLDQFKQAWFSIGFLYPGLHPAGALEHGSQTSADTTGFPEVRRVEPRLLAPYYVQSGWPVALEQVAKEAWRRYEAKELSADEFYCSDAVFAGMSYRAPSRSNRAGREQRRALA
jgi:DNA (cytosine-5)-methyltransferase 1